MKLGLKKQHFFAPRLTVSVKTVLYNAPKPISTGAQNPHSAIRNPKCEGRICQNLVVETNREGPQKASKILDHLVFR